MSSFTLGLITNPKAGLRGGSVEDCRRALGNTLQVEHVVTGSSLELPAALARLASRNVSILAVNGGDGTLQHVLTRMLTDGGFQQLPAIAPLPGGRTNMSAADLKCSKTPAMALTSLRKAIETGAIQEHYVKRQVLRIDAESDGSSQFGMFFGSGVIQRALELKHQYYPRKRLQGLWGAGLFLAASLLRIGVGGSAGIFAPDEIGIYSDKRELASAKAWPSPNTNPYQLVMATTLNRLIFGISPFWGCERGNLRFTAVSAAASRNPLVVCRVLRGRQPAHLDSELGYRSFNAQQLRLRLDCGFTIDGELFKSEPGRTLRLSTDDRIQFVRA